MTLVYFDTNIWNRLVEPDASPFTVVQLVSAYRSGRLAVVGSVVTVHELVGAARSNMRKYKLMHGAFWRLVGPRVLRPLDERHKDERVAGGPLPLDRRYLSKRSIARVRESTAGGHAASTLSEAVVAQKLERFSTDKHAKASATTDLFEAGLDPRAAVQAWFEEASIDEWAAEAVGSGVEHGLDSLPAGEDVRLDTMPSAWLFAGYAMARVHQTIGLGEELKRSDRDDGEHCACGAYLDIFVTDDRSLLQTLATIDGLPFTPMNIAEFAQWLNDTEEGEPTHVGRTTPG